MSVDGFWNFHGIHIDAAKERELNSVLDMMITDRNVFRCVLALNFRMIDTSIWSEIHTAVNSNGIHAANEKVQ